MYRVFLRIFSAFLLLSMLLCTFSCAKKEPVRTLAAENTSSQGDAISTFPTDGSDPIPTITVEHETEIDTIPVPDGINPLTGLPCDPATENNRPLAVMINNLKPALPQAGVSEFDILYEVLAEGGILRLEGLIQDFSNLERIGSVRSARPYYVQIAAAYDAFYAHAGGSVAGKNEISRLGVNNLDGLAYDGVVLDGVRTYYRDQERLDNGTSFEHTLFATGEGLKKILESRGYRQQLKNTEFSAFSFVSELEWSGEEKSATYIKIPHSTTSVSEFHFRDGLYYHEQYGSAHIDSLNGEQVATENVFVLFASHRSNGDASGTLTITLTGEGSGFYFTDGKVIPITWKRQSETGTFQYFNEDGRELSVRCGKSYVSIVDKAISSAITISEEK